MYNLAVYDDKFYDSFGYEARLMADWFMPLVCDVVPFESMIDFGCGEGFYVAWCLEHGYRAIGIEGSPAAIRRSIANVVCRDLRKPFEMTESYDLAFSLEVAEHVEAEYAQVFVESLSKSRWVVMTAASPGQGGLCHVNEQPQQYWEQLFRGCGMEPDSERRSKLQDAVRAATDDGKYVTPWLLRNLMVFRRA